MMMRRIILAAAVLTLVGCGLVAPTPSAPIQTATPDFVRHLDAGDGLIRSLLIYDPGGLLVDVRVPSSAPCCAYQATWKPVLDDPNSLTLAWVGGQCPIDPTLHVTRQGDTNQGILLSLAIFGGHLPSLPPNEGCGDVGIGYGVVLIFRRPISDFRISITESYEPE